MRKTGFISMDAYKFQKQKVVKIGTYKKITRQVDQDNLAYTTFWLWEIFEVIVQKLYGISVLYLYFFRMLCRI